MIELVKYKKEDLYLDYLEITKKKSLEWKGNPLQIKVLFESIFSLNTDYRGEILYNKKNVLDLTVTEKVSFAKDYSLVFDIGGLLSNQTLKDNILLPFYYHKVFTKHIEKEVENIFNSMGQSENLNKRPFYVPENLRKLTGIIRAALWQPKVLFLENISMTLENEDLLFLKDYLESKKISLHYYDSLGKFSYKNSDTFHINQSMVDSA